MDSRTTVADCKMWETCGTSGRWADIQHHKIFLRENSEFTCPRLPKHSITTQTLDVVKYVVISFQDQKLAIQKTHQKDSLQVNNQNQNLTRNSNWSVFGQALGVPEIEKFAAGLAVQSRGTQVAGDKRDVTHRCCRKPWGPCHAFVTLRRWYFFPFFVTHSDHGTKSALAYVKWSESATIACFGSVALQRRVAASESERKSISLKALEGCKTHQMYTTTDGQCACTEMLVFLKPRRSTMLPISKKQAGWACAAWLIMSCCCTLDVVGKGPFLRLYSELFLLPFEMMPQYLLFWKHSQRRSLTFFLVTDWARLDGVLHHPRLGHRDLAPCHVFGWLWLFHVI